MRSGIFTFFSLLLILFCAAFAAAQSAEDPSSSRRGERDEVPKSVREMLSKMEIEQSKKEYQELLDRGEELVTITGQLEKSVESTGGQLDRSEMEKLAAAEKLVKKIRGELGGGDDDGEAESDPPKLSDKADAIKYLKKQASELVDELKKSSRFTVSVVAIQSSNTLLRVVRFLRTGN
jgi:hypothetical protein